MLLKMELNPLSIDCDPIMNKTNIAWTDFTWNPVTGCTAVTDGCKNCYAKMVHERFYDTPFSEIVFHEDRLSSPFGRKKSAKIFIGSMTDLFQDEVSFETIDKIIAVVALNQQHTFQILTKRPKRMYDYFEMHFTRHKIAVEAMSYTDNIGEHGCDDGICNMEFPLKNLHIGVTAENQKEADIRIPLLLEIPAYKRFVSIEPMIGEINLDMLIKPDMGNRFRVVLSSLMGVKTLWDGRSLQTEEEVNKLDWVIVGGESGAKSKVREMLPVWVEQIHNDCKKSSVAFFFKQWGAFEPKESFSFEKVREEVGQHASH